MSLGIYFRDSAGAMSLVTNGSDSSNPVTTIHDGKNGDTISVVLYLRNDNITKWYSNITIVPVDLVDTDPYGDVIYTETGWGVKVNKGGDEPTDAEWGDVDWGDDANMDDVGSNVAGDSTTYFPFWYLISCPPNENAQNKSDIVLQVNHTENAV